MRRLLLALCLVATGCGLTTTSTPSAESPTVLAWRHFSGVQRSGLYAASPFIEGDALAPRLAMLEQWTQHRFVLADANLVDRDFVGYSVWRSRVLGWVILIDRDLPANMRFYTLVHELAHVLGPPLPDPDSEVFAEMTAAQVSEAVGFDFWAHTATYLKSRATLEQQERIAYRWAPQMDAIVRVLRNVI